MTSIDYTNMFEIESRRAYLVYDAESGAVVHLHRITTFRGGEGLPVEQHEARALEMAQRMGHTSERLRVLSVDPNESPAQRVDLETMKPVREQPAAI